VGGTKLAAAVVDDAGTVLRSATVATVADDAEALFSLLAGLVDTVRAGDEVVCGVGCGGPMAPGGEEVSPLNIPVWRGFPLRSRLAALTGVPTFVDNDAKALALGEGWRGAAAGVGDYIAMVVSTGVGGGIVLGGRLLDGATGNAGHIGHVVVVPDGRRCACGGYGCLEAEASGSSIHAATGRPASSAGPDVVARTGMLVGRAVASVANLLDLRLAVVAGSVALGFGPPFFTAAQAEVDRLACLSFSRGTRVAPAGLGDVGPLVGAAAVGWRGIGRDLGVGGSEAAAGAGFEAAPAGGSAPAVAAGGSGVVASGSAGGGPAAGSGLSETAARGSAVTESAVGLP
jgi:glucokinase